MARDVWEFDVFRRAYELSLVVHQQSQAWPKQEQWSGIADQLRRASKAVCVLLVEGNGRQVGSDAEMRRYVIMALASADECRLWCRYAADLGYLDPVTAASWQAGYAEIARMLQGYRKHLTSSLKSDD